MNVLVRALALALVSFPAQTPAAEVPPYPYAKPPPPPWEVAFRKKLKETKCTMSLEQIPLREALRRIAEATGLSIEISRQVEESAEKPVDLSFKEMRAIDVLGQIATLTDLWYELTERGVVFTEPSKKWEDFYSDKLRIGESIEEARKKHFPTKEEKVTETERRARAKRAEAESKRKIEERRKALRSAKVTRDLVDASFSEVLKALSEAAKVSILCTEDARAKAAEGKFTVKGGSRSVEKVLGEFLSSLGLEIEVREDSCLVIRAGAAKKIMYQVLFWTREEKERDERKILSLELTKDLKGAQVCDFVGGLAEDIGVEVYPDRAAWAAEVALPTETSGLTVRQLAAVLKKKGIDTAIDVSPFNPRVFWLPQGTRLTKVPPDAPDMKWAIYLIQPGK